MKSKKPSNPRQLLSIAIGEKQVYCAHIKLHGSIATTAAQFSFEMTEQATLDNPTAFAQHLREQLNQHSIKVGDAVVGLSSKHYFAKKKPLPAGASAQTKLDVLRLAVERDYGDAQLCFDMVDASSEQGRAAMLVGLRKQTLDHVKEICAAADLRLLGVTSTVLAVSYDISSERENRHVVLLTDQSAEVCAGQDESTALLSHVAMQGDATLLSSQAGSIKRSLMDHAIASVDMLIIPTPTTPTALIEATTQALSDAAVTAAINPAESVAREFAQHRDRCVNWLNNTLAAPPPAGYPRLRRYGLLAVATLLGLALIGGWMLYDMSANLAAKQDELAKVAPDAKRLDAIRGQMKKVSPWVSDRPAYLACLASLTECFPTKGKIWVTNLKVDEELIGTINGRSDSSQTMLSCLHAMQAAATFTDVQLRDWNEADRKQGLISFEIEFVYQPGRTQDKDG